MTKLFLTGEFSLCILSRLPCLSGVSSIRKCRSWQAHLFFLYFSSSVFLFIYIFIDVFRFFLILLIFFDFYFDFFWFWFFSSWFWFFIFSDGFQNVWYYSEWFAPRAYVCTCVYLYVHVHVYAWMWLCTCVLVLIGNGVKTNLSWYNLLHRKHRILVIWQVIIAPNN